MHRRRRVCTIVLFVLMLGTIVCLAAAYRCSARRRRQSVPAPAPALPPDSCAEAVPDHGVGARTLTVDTPLVFDEHGDPAPAGSDEVPADGVWEWWHERHGDEPVVCIRGTAQYGVAGGTLPPVQQVHVADGACLYLRAAGCGPEPSSIEVSVFLLGKGSRLYLLPCSTHSPAHPLLVHGSCFVRGWNEEDQHTIDDLRSKVCRLQRDLNSRLALGNTSTALEFHLADFLLDECVADYAPVCT